MDTEERIKALQEEFQETKEELQHMLYDIRTYLMEAISPIPNDLERERLDSLLDENDAEKREALRVQTDSVKQGALRAQADSEKQEDLHAQDDSEAQEIPSIGSDS